MAMLPTVVTGSSLIPTHTGPRTFVSTIVGLQLVDVPLGYMHPPDCIYCQQDRFGTHVVLEFIINHHYQPQCLYMTIVELMVVGGICK